MRFGIFVLLLGMADLVNAANNDRIEDRVYDLTCSSSNLILTVTRISKDTIRASNGCPGFGAACNIILDDELDEIHQGNMLGATVYRMFMKNFLLSNPSKTQKGRKCYKDALGSGPYLPVEIVTVGDLRDAIYSALGCACR